MDQVAEIGSVGVSITFGCAHRQPSGAVELLEVNVRDKDLQAGKSVYEGYSDGFELLARFFEDLAASWRGWIGERVYESIEHDLRLVATHDGHVRLRVRLWQSADPDGWTVETVVALDAGEQLSQAARDIASLVRPDPRRQ
jgi:hypothetical protein